MSEEPKREGFYISWGKISSLLSSALVCCRFARAGGAGSSVEGAVAVTLQSSDRLTGWNTEYAPVSFALMPNETASLALFCLSSGPRCLADAVSARVGHDEPSHPPQMFFFIFINAIYAKESLALQLTSVIKIVFAFCF